MSLGIVGACARKAGGTARQTEPQECSNRCEGGCGAAVELTVRGHDVDFVVQQKEMEKKWDFNSLKVTKGERNGI